MAKAQLDTLPIEMMKIPPKIPDIDVDQIQVLSSAESSATSTSSSLPSAESSRPKPLKKAQKYSSHSDLRAYMESKGKIQTSTKANKEETETVSNEAAVKSETDDASTSNRSVLHQRISTTQEIKSTWNLQLLKRPPIREMTARETSDAIQKLELSIADWVKPIELPPKRGDMSDQETEEWNNQASEIRAWNNRGKNTSHMLRKMARDCLFSEKFLGYFLHDEPVGILVMEPGESKKDSPYIEYIVTHPGSWRCGGILIEQAVAISDKEWKKGGKLTLYAEYPEAIRAYEALGFVRDNAKSNYMTLDPSSPANEKRWCKDNEGWRLIKHIDREYFGKRKQELGLNG